MRVKENGRFSIFLAFLASAVLASAALGGLSAADGASLWGRALGGNAEDAFQMVEPSPDGGFYAAGRTLSFGGAAEIWVAKFDGAGQVKWQKRYGGAADDDASRLFATSDGGLILLGSTKSFGSGDCDIWVLKLDTQGRVKWQKAYGGSKMENAYDLRPTKDGGFIVVGNTWTYGSSVAAAAWLLKLSGGGTVLWQKSYKVGDYADYPRAVLQTADGGFLMAGSTFNAGVYGMPWEDAWAMKLDASGQPAWTKGINGSYNESAETAIETSDGGYLIAGETNSYGAGGTDIWIMKLSQGGNPVWQKTIGGSNGDSARWIQEVKKGLYILGGETASSGKGGTDAFAMKLGATGNSLWQKTYGGSDSDEAASIRPLKDGRYVLAGRTTSFGSGDADGLILLAAATGMSGAGITKKASFAPRTVKFADLSWTVNANTTRAKTKTTNAKVSSTKAVNTRIFN